MCHDTQIRVSWVSIAMEKLQAFYLQSIQCLFSKTDDIVLTPKFDKFCFDNFRRPILNSGLEVLWKYFCRHTHFLCFFQVQFHGEMVLNCIKL